MAELTAIGWVVSPMIKKMMEKISSSIMGRYRGDRDMKKDLEKLQRTLLQIQVVVDKARGWHTMEDSQKQLLRQLRDAAYEANDLLDDFEYQDMKEQATVAEGMVSHVMSSSIKFGKRLVGQDQLCSNLIEILKKLEDIKETADFVVKLVGAEKNSVVEQVEISSSRVTGSILTETKIVGRDREKDEIVSLLLKSTTNEPESSYTSIPIVSIIGDGGIGKTTLAQNIYNDQRIKDHFPLRMWICVYDNFDVTKLTREMLESVSASDEKYEGFMNFNMLQQKLQSKLELKRFLLVLDDVWPDEKRGESQNEEMWKKLLAPLQDGARDSKILVTTRMEIIAKRFGVTNPIFLKGLTKDETWSLLSKHAFGNENPNNYPELKEIGMQIAERLKGSPLACKVIGCMLRDRLDATKWKEILEREIYNDIMSILRLGYQRLPDHLKQCFAYCSIFPKDWHFEVEKLVLLWIAQDYIVTPVRNDRLLVDVGTDYFNELLLRSFFEKVEQDSCTYYVIHDLLHELAGFVSVEECFRVEHGNMRKIMQHVHHLGVDINVESVLRDFVSQLEETNNFQNLRTLIFFGDFRMRQRNLPLAMFRKLKFLRVLVFCHGLWEGVVPESIGALTHLRYLDVGDGRDFLPESSCELYNLQVLAAHQELSFCGSMTKMIKFGKLGHLDVPYLVFRVEKKGGHRIGALKGMEAVLPGILEIENLENATSKKEAVEADLGSKQHLYGLALQWSAERRDDKWTQAADREVAEALKPHPNLKWLLINEFGGIRSPSWLEMTWMTNLETIHLFDCRRLAVLPPLGHLPLLKDLRIRGMNALKRVDTEFYGGDDSGVSGFPSLEVLSFQGMPQWSMWCPVDFPVFPQLRKLYILKCPSLMSLPLFSDRTPGFRRLHLLVVQECRKLLGFFLFPPTLSTIDISHTGSISHLKLRPLESSSSLECFAMESSIVPSSAELHDHTLAAIENLKIRNCTEPMRVGWYVKLATLKELELNSCQELLATDVLPASLESLVLCNCRVTDRWVSRCMHGLTSLSQLTINGCAGLTSLPSAQVLQRLIALQTLCIRSCEELTSLGALHCLLSLKSLWLFDCLELKSLPEQGLPASIEVLFLHNSHPALMQQIRKKKGPEWDKVAHIPRIDID